MKMREIDAVFTSSKFIDTYEKLNHLNSCYGFRGPICEPKQKKKKYVPREKEMEAKNMNFGQWIKEEKK